MPSLPHFMREFRYLLRLGFFLVVAGMLVLAGCSKAFKVEDPQLKPIQEMLDTNLPPGTPDGAVSQFLATRAYPTEPSEKPSTMVAIIRHIDTEKLQPVTARVTFHFDANGKLQNYEMVRTINAPIPQ
jgi:hypothetical protein